MVLFDATETGAQWISSTAATVTTATATATAAIATGATSAVTATVATTALTQCIYAGAKRVRLTRPSVISWLASVLTRLTPVLARSTCVTTWPVARRFVAALWSKTLAL